MDKTKKPVALLVLAVFCFALASSSCAKKEEPPLEETTQPQRRVFVSGSAAVMPLLKTLAREFSEEETDIEVIFLPDSHSDAAIAGTTEERYDIGAISRERLSDEKGSPLRYLHLAIDGLVFVTNTDVLISDLDSSQIKGVYAGNITNWAQVGGPDAKIAVVDRPEHTSAKIAFRRAFLGEDLQVTSEAVVVERPWQVSDSVQLIPHSIGYTSFGEIAMENPPVNIISVNRIVPTPSNLRHGHYKFFRPLGLVLGRSPKASTMRFVNFIFSETGSRIIENSGYVPQRYEILIGIVPEQDVISQSQRYKPLASYLSGKLGEAFSVNLKLFPTYIEVCRALADGDINGAFLGSLAYTTVRKYVDVLARPDYNGISTYRGIIFVRADSNIEGLEQIQDKRLVMGGKTTTAGFVFPLYYFKRQGIPDYRSYFSESYFTGTHEDAILAVLENKADVGAAKDLVFRMIARKNPLVVSELKILAQSPAVPSNAFVVRKDIESPCFDCHRRLRNDIGPGGENLSQVKLATALKEYLLSLDKDPEGGKALRAIGNASRFLETTDSDYSELYKMLEEINLDPEILLARD